MVCEPDLGYLLPSTRQRDGQSHTEVAASSAEKNSGGQGHYSLSVHHARIWSGALIIQLVPSSIASLQFFDPMQQLHNEKYFAR
eukprot:1156925-Pelagomonas_calceolata.AAC.5